MSSAKYNHNDSGPTGSSLMQKEETKVREDRYRVLIEDVADGFYEVDLQGNFKFFNDAFFFFAVPRLPSTRIPGSRGS